MQFLFEKLNNQKRCFVVTANPEIFMLAQQNKQLDDMLLNDRTVIVPDGIGLIWAGKKIGYEMQERIPGVEVCESLLQYADKERKSIYFFGASKEVLDALVSKMKTEYTNMKILGYADGYIDDKDAKMREIAQLKPDIVLVALGMPLQEQLIYRHLNEFEKGVLIGVGGSFDVLSGVKNRAPKIFLKLNLEWLYRISKEPFRLKRFFDNNVRFLHYIWKMKG